MQIIKLGIIGLGTVGCGVVSTLQKNRDYYKQKYGFYFEVIIVCVRNTSKSRDCDTSKFVITDRPEEVLNHPDVEIVLELIGGTNLSFDLTAKALAQSKNVVTANKALIAEKGDKLFEIAKANNSEIRYEAAVAGGIPIIKNLCDSLTANPINSIAGIINGTSNYILTELKQPNAVFEEVLKHAQELGYAEEDPTFDIEGIDAAHKIHIMASIAFNSALNFENLYIEGISEITALDIHYANILGYQIKHLGIANRYEDYVITRVHPTLIKNDNIMAHVEGVTNAVSVENLNSGITFFAGAGAGSMATASAVVADLINLTQKQRQPSLMSRENKLTNLSIDKIESAYYLRMNVADRTGILAKITDIFTNHNINIELVHQDHNQDDTATIVIITNKTPEYQMQDSMQKIANLGLLLSKAQLIRVLATQ